MDFLYLSSKGHIEVILKTYKLVLIIYFLEVVYLIFQITFFLKQFIEIWLININPLQ